MLIVVGILGISLQITSKYVINWNNYEKEIIEQLEESFGKGSISISNLDGSLLMPKINVYNLYLSQANSGSMSNDILVIPKIELRISIFSMLFLTPKISALNIKSADLKLSQVKNLFSIITHSKKTISAINIENGTLRLDSDLFKNIKFKKLSLTLDDTFSMTTNIIIGERKYKAALYFNTTQQNFSLDSDLLKATFYGKKSHGTLDIHGTNFANSIGNIIKPISFNTTMWGKFTISGDISWSADSFNINNLTLLDDNINIDLKLERIYSKNYTNLNISINKINLDDLLSTKEQQNFSLLDLLQQYLEGDQPNEASGKILLYAADIRYKNGLVDNVKFDSVINGKTLNINKFIFNLPGPTEVDITGNILNNSIFSRFNGNISLFSKNPKVFLEWALPINKQTDAGTLNLNSDISITPKSFSLSNTKLSLDNFTAGSTLFIRSDMKGKQVKVELAIDNLNLDSYNLNHTNGNNILSSINYEVDFDLNAHNIYYHDHVFDDFSFRLLSDTGKIFLKDIKCDSQDLQIGANITLVKKGIDTSIDANITADYINSEIFKLPGILDINDDPDSPSVTWSSKPVSWFGLDELSGKITAKIKKLDTEYFSLNNTNVSLSLGNKLLSINKFNGELDDNGKIDLTANIGMESESSILLSFSLNNINIPTIAHNIFNIESITEGKFSCVGSIKSKGNNINQLVQNSDGKMEIASRHIKIKDFDIDQLFYKIPTIKSNSELATLTKVLIYSNETNIDYLNGLTNIKNGRAANTLQFKTKRSTGVLSSHLSLINFNTNSAMRFFFINEHNTSKILSIDMNISGPIWLPKISFDNNKIYDMIIDNKV